MPKRCYDVFRGRTYTKQRRVANVGQLNNRGASDGTPKRWRTDRKSVSWSSGPPESMRDAIARITDNGAAILFSRTTDGGALVLQVLDGQERSKEYITEPGDIVPCLSWLLETYG
jgi:hypothetical protein